MNPRLLCVVVLSGFVSSCALVRQGPPPAQVKLTPLADRVRIEIDGRLFSEYIFKGATRPYLYPILAEDGTSLTRDFPMKQTEGEEVDHPHHRAVMFAHASVNGIDFWNEGAAGGRTVPKGSILHDGLVETKNGPVAVIRAKNRWVSPDGKLICTDESTIRVTQTPSGPALDYEVTLHALPDTPLHMGDNKDGVAAVRVAQWMTLPHKYQGKDVPGNGRYVNSADVRDAAAWGKRAAWCDLYAPKGDKIYGIAIFNHPQNLRHPTWWMARDYGLFGANPFGQHDFENLKDQPKIGDYEIPAGGSLTLRYRFLFHMGDEKAAAIGVRYAEYVAAQAL
ncbi:MAG TPA: PmoA family protein [Opitutaceae bacterium]|nr:PmoA family protein [Opitutaceae bacterium]